MLGMDPVSSAQEWATIPGRGRSAQPALKNHGVFIKARPITSFSAEDYYGQLYKLSFLSFSFD